MTKKCLYCSENHDRRGDYCSDSCKQGAYRRRNATVTESNRNAPTVTRSIGLKFTGKMTDFEREHYHSASELAEMGKTEGRRVFNPVSKPGDSHYTEKL